MQKDIQNDQVVQVVNFFKGKPVNDQVLAEYCNLNNIPNVITAEDFPNLVEAIDYEEKLKAFFPKCMETLLRLRPNVDFVSKAEFDSTLATNNGVWLDIISYAIDAGFSPFWAKQAVKDVLKVVQNPFVEAEKKMTKREESVLEILLSKNGGFTLKNLSDVYNEANPPKA